MHKIHSMIKEEDVNIGEVIKQFCSFTYNMNLEDLCLIWSKHLF